MQIGFGSFFAITANKFAVLNLMQSIFEKDSVFFIMMRCAWIRCNSTSIKQHASKHQYKWRF